MNWEQLWLGLALAAPAALLGYLTHRRSKQVDATSAESGAASNHRAGTAQVIEGLRGLIDELQEDNKNFRDDIKNLVTRCDEITKERDTLRIEVARLRKRYGVNGPEDTPQPSNKENPPGLT